MSGAEPGGSNTRRPAEQNEEGAEDLSGGTCGHEQAVARDGDDRVVVLTMMAATTTGATAPTATATATAATATAAATGEAGPGGLGARRTRIVTSHGQTTFLTPVNRKRVGRRVWAFWADLEPGTMLPHPAVMLLLDVHRGKIVSERMMADWPLINGHPWVPSAPVRGHARDTTARTAGPLRAPLLAHAAPAPPAPTSRIIEIGDYGDPQANVDFAAWARFAGPATGRPVIKADDPASLLAAIRDACNEGTPDVLIYANGHQLTPPPCETIWPKNLRDRFWGWLNDTFGGTQPGPYISLATKTTGFPTNLLGHTWKTKVITAKDFRDVIATAKRPYPGVKVTTVVEACGSGNFMTSLYGVSDRVITSVGPTSDSLGPPSGQLGSAVTVLPGGDHGRLRQAARWLPDGS